MSYANKKGADQPAHPRNLTSIFVVRCLDSVMSLVSVTKISSLLLASAAEQDSLSLTWLETPEDTFSHDVAHVFFLILFTVLLVIHVLVISKHVNFRCVTDSYSQFLMTRSGEVCCFCFF